MKDYFNQKSGRENPKSDRKHTRVIAGPGTGKTTQMMKRIVELLENRVDPERILVCTFTRAAANDLLKSLAADGMPSEAKRIKAVTLHSLSFGLLMQENVLKHTGRKPRPLLKFEKRFLCEDLKTEEFGGFNGVGELIDKFAAAWATEQHKDPSWPTEPIEIKFQRVLKEWLVTHNAMLIEEMIPETFNFLRFNPNSKTFSEYSYVFIHEYQDLNKVEQELLDLISKNSQVTIFGDENQSIYSFKYAFSDGITTYHQTHPGTQDNTLKVSYRCSEPVVGMANSLISQNSSCVDREMKPSDPSRKTEVNLLQWQNYCDECDGISKIVSRLINEKGYKPGQIIILAPNKYFAMDLLQQLSKRNVEAKSFFTDPLFEINPRKADVCQALYSLSLLRYFTDPSDLVSLRCLMGYGQPDLNSNNWKKLLSHCYETGHTYSEALNMILNGTLILSKSTKLRDRFKVLQERMQDLKGLVGLELVDMLFPANEDWAKQLRSFSLDLDVATIEPKSLNDHLVTTLSQPELPVDVDYVRIMSLFKSKGLTSDVVVIVGVVQDLLPHPPKLKWTVNQKLKDLEEQRRMFYVGLTRAKKELILSYFEQIDIQLGRKMRLPAEDSRSYISTKYSPFLPELGPSCPDPKRGEEY